MVHYLTIYIYIYPKKKIYVMHSLTNTLRSRVHKPGFPKWSRLVGGGNMGRQVTWLCW